MYTLKSSMFVTNDYKTLKTRLPVRSVLLEQRTGGLVVRWVITGLLNTALVEIRRVLERPVLGNIRDAFRHSCRCAFSNRTNQLVLAGSAQLSRNLEVLLTKNTQEDQVAGDFGGTSFFCTVRSWLLDAHWLFSGRLFLTSFSPLS